MTKRATPGPRAPVERSPWPIAERDSRLRSSDRCHRGYLSSQGWRLRQTNPERPGQVGWLAWQGDPETPATTKIEPIEYNPRERPWFSGALRAEDVNGKRRVVALDVLLLDITRFTRDLALSERGGVIVLDDQAQLIGLPADPRLSEFETPEQNLTQDMPAGNANANDWPPLSDAETAFSRADAKTQLIRFRSEGKAWWGARQPFPLSPEQRLWIEVLVPESELLDELAALPYAVVLFLLAVIATAAWRMHAVSRRFSEPITQLVTASERLRQGDFRESPPQGTKYSRAQAPTRGAEQNAHRSRARRDRRPAQ